MFGWARIASLGLGIVDKALAIWRFMQGEKHDREQQEVGAIKQRETDKDVAIKVKDEQLDIAAKPDETRRELLDKAKGRKRGP